MQELREKLERMVELMGFRDFSVNASEDSNRISIAIRDRVVEGDNLPVFVLNLDRITRLMAKQLDKNPVIVDVNFYRKQREELIIKLARAAARKTTATGDDVSLPAMNAYERLLVHTELAVRPDVATESVGEGRNRYVVVKPI